MTSTDAPQRADETVHAVRRFAATPEGVYGLVVVAGLIVVARDIPESPGRTLLAVIATLVVFFVVHVYAGAVAQLSSDDDRGGIRDAVAHSVRHAVPLLAMGCVPIIVLALSVIGVLAPTEAVWAALVIDAALLGTLGWFLAARRTRNPWRRIGGAAATAGIGVVMIVLKALLH